MPASNGADRNTLETVGWQLAMAFGQGSGTILATPAALRLAFEAYRASLTNHLSDWDEYSLLTIEYCRLLGKLSAHYAIADDRYVIDAPDVRHALEVIRKKSTWPLETCKITGLREGQSR